jgi:nicotinamidase-related amidase
VNKFIIVNIKEKWTWGDILKQILRSTKPAVVAIDLHRGHLDPEVATMPLAAEKCQSIINANEQFFNQCRQLEIPIIHLVTLYRNEEEILSNPFWRAKNEDPNVSRKNVGKHNLYYMPGVEVIPSLIKDGDHVVDTKKRYNCFRATDLEFLLRSMGIDTLLVTGVNTNSCVLATSVDACNRDFKVVVVEDCVDTMDGEEAHQAGLKVISTAFGWVMPSSDIIRFYNNKKVSKGAV